MCRSGKVKDHKIGLHKPADAFGPARCAGPKPHDQANIDTAESQLLYAAIAAAVGLYFIAVGACLLPIPGGPSNLHSPLWVLLCAGAVFFFASAALVIQSFGASTATGELPADTPRWLRILAIRDRRRDLRLLRAIASWIALGPGERQFSGTVMTGNATIDAAVARPPASARSSSGSPPR